MFRTNQIYRVTMLIGIGKSQRKITEEATYMGKVNSHPEVVTFQFQRVKKNQDQKETFAISEKLIHSFIQV